MMARHAKALIEVRFRDLFFRSPLALGGFVTLCFLNEPACVGKGLLTSLATLQQRRPGGSA